MITFEDFEKCDIRVGKILEVEVLENARYTTHKLMIDLGPELGIKKSGARAIEYTPEELQGKMVLCLVNLPPRQIGSFMSEVLTLGVPKENGECALISPSPKEGTILGGKLY